MAKKTKPSRHRVTVLVSQEVWDTIGQVGGEMGCSRPVVASVLLDSMTVGLLSARLTFERNAAARAGRRLRKARI